MRAVLTVLLTGYAMACVVALGVAAVGIFAAEPEPLAAVYAILLASPWFMLGAEIWPQGTGLNFVILACCMLVNASILALLRRVLSRRRSQAGVGVSGRGRL